MKDNIMSDLRAYGIARDTAKDMTAESGTKLLGFNNTPTEYEITVAQPFDLAEYNTDVAIVADDSLQFNLIVREDNPDAIKSLPKDKLRRVLTRILDSV